ncbi:hypothetical protein INR49_009495 [Caranx melampygus]|nr:hypothetical protein INR49_009495 [Caranx melampygus]
MAPLLPPLGSEVFRRFTPASLEEIQRRYEAEEEERQRRKVKKIEIAEEDLPKPASDLEAGKPLPFIYGDPPPELLNTPLEELDPFYQSQKLFMGNLRQKCVLMPPVLHNHTTEISYHGNNTDGNHIHGNDTGSSDFDFYKYINDPGTS